MSRPEILVAIPLPADTLAALREPYVLRTALDEAAGARAVITNGSKGFSAVQMAALPKLELILAFGAGYENIDLGAAYTRGIPVSHGPGANDSTVADHALALMLGLARGLVPLDHAVREGRWEAARGERPTLSGGRLGMVGLGRIGRKIAVRAAAFEMKIGYHSRTPREDVEWQHYADVTALASASDYLVVACPGGPATRHLVDARVLNALGPDGFLVNIARGSIVDTQALIEALETHRIAGAGLDVIEGEPAVPPALAALPNVLFTPHIAGRSPAALAAQRELLLANLAAHFAGKPLITPVAPAAPATV